jgi:hypothetical protein
MCPKIFNFEFRKICVTVYEINGEAYLRLYKNQEILPSDMAEN